MALLGLGLIAVSICFFVYRTSSKRWYQIFGTQQTKLALPEGEKSREKHIASDASRIPDEKQEDSQQDQATTPKAQAQSVSITAAVPLFNLHQPEKETPQPSTNSSIQNTQGPSTRAPMVTSTKQNTSMLPPPPPKPSSTSLMPPPSVKPSALRPLPKLSGSLAPPPSAASTLRGPQNSSKIAPSTSTLPPSQRASKKVQLEPGHSPLDWANLIHDPSNSSYLRGVNLPPQLIKVTPSQLKKQTGRKGLDAWGTYQGKVYNLSPYLKFHPGGVGELLRGAGKVGEAERLFVEIHPWVNWHGMLHECLVGILVSEDTTSTMDLEAMD